MAGTTGLEPATSDVTGANARRLLSMKWLPLERVVDDSKRHLPTGNDPFPHLQLTQLLAHFRKLQNHGVHIIQVPSNVQIQMLRNLLSNFDPLYAGLVPPAHTKVLRLPDYGYHKRVLDLPSVAIPQRGAKRMAHY